MSPSLYLPFLSFSNSRFICIFLVKIPSNPFNDRITILTVRLAPNLQASASDPKIGKKQLIPKTNGINGWKWGEGGLGACGVCAVDDGSPHPSYICSSSGGIGAINPKRLLSAGGSCQSSINGQTT